MHVVGVSLCNVEGGREHTKLRTRRERKGKPSLNLVNVTTLALVIPHTRIACVVSSDFTSKVTCSFILTLDRLLLVISIYNPLLQSKHNLLHVVVHSPHFYSISPIMSFTWIHTYISNVYIKKPYTASDAFHQLNTKWWLGSLISGSLLCCCYRIISGH